MAEKEPGPMPDYQNPPVTEVVCGILFKSIDGLLAPHLGTLWEQYKAEYSVCKEVAPLMPVVERFQRVSGAAFTIETTDVPMLPRIWFMQEEGNGIIQVQRDRFLHNWRKLKPEDEYPHYGHVIKLFGRHLETFEVFLNASKLPSIEPLQYEMTYVNLIPKGDGWDTFGQVGSVFPDFAWRTQKDRFLPSPEHVRWRTSFVLPEQAGRLHITIQDVLRRSDECEALQLELVVRGMPQDKGRAAMWQWFDMAREWIVRGFTDITGAAVQEKVWRRKA